MLREQAEKDLRAPELSQRQVLATVVQLLDKTLIRIGTEEYAKENKSYGLTTLRGKHVTVDGSTMQFSFRGKSGVQHALSVMDKRIARIVQQCQHLKGEELFQYVDEEGKQVTIGSDDVNAYLAELSGLHITAKDFRTWGGTMLAGTKLRELGSVSTQREAKKNINVAIDAVAERLGNTRAVCRSYYIHPALLEAYMGGRTAGPSMELPKKKGPSKKRVSGKASSRRRPVAALRRDEVAILQFLHDLV